MTLNGNLWNALLSMDAYNRGYGAGIITPELSDVSGIKIGNYAVAGTSTVLGPNVDQSAGFYAIAYEDQTTHEKIISYRGKETAHHLHTPIQGVAPPTPGTVVGFCE